METLRDLEIDETRIIIFRPGEINPESLLQCFYMGKYFREEGTCISAVYSSNATTASMSVTEFIKGYDNRAFKEIHYDVDLSDIRLRDKKIKQEISRWMEIHNTKLSYDEVSHWVLYGIKKNLEKVKKQGELAYKKLRGIIQNHAGQNILVCTHSLNRIIPLLAHIGNTEIYKDLIILPQQLLYLEFNPRANEFSEPILENNVQRLKN